MSECVFHSLAASLKEIRPLNDAELHDIKIFMRIDGEAAAQNDVWSQTLNSEGKLTMGVTTIGDVRLGSQGGTVEFVNRVPGSAVSLNRATTIQGVTTEQAVPYTKLGPELENSLVRTYEPIALNPLVKDVDFTGISDEQRLAIGEAYNIREQQIKDLAFESNGKLISDINNTDVNGNPITYVDQNMKISNTQYDGMRTDEALAEGKIQVNGALTSNDFLPAGTTTDKDGKLVGGGGTGGGSGECCIFNEFGGGGCGPCR